MKAPAFWQENNSGLMGQLLRPLGWLYGVGAQMNQSSASPVEVPVPVLCIGNVVAGGAGKTPVALDIGQRLVAAGLGIEYLSRGYGGSFKGPHLVQVDDDTADQVGDEPLLLARTARTWVAKDRIKGAFAMVEAGAGAIVMDDGLQNPSLYKNMALLVIDGTYGIGNGRVMPAGPLREPLDQALKKVQAVVIMGDDRAGVADQVRQLAPEMEILSASVQPRPDGPKIAGKRVHAFAGIARPEKLFDTVRGLGGELVQTTAFADHHVYGDAELQSLVDAAVADQALLLTTEKDHVRLDLRWQAQIKALGISIVWEDEDRLLAVLDRFRGIGHT